MRDTPARLLTLLSLLQRPREWPGRELAERLHVSARTVRRDVDRLRELGYPIEATLGTAGGYRLVAGTAMPPLLLDDDEAAAVAVGLRTVAAQAIEGIGESSIRALAKLEHVLPSRLRRRVGAIGAATVSLPAAGPMVDPAVLTTIASAVTNRERLRFRYRVAVEATGADENSSRTTEPYRVVSAGRRWYLLAFDVVRDDWRIFRVDRIYDPTATGARFAPRALPADDPVTYVTEKLHSLAPTYRAVAIVHTPLAQAAEALGHTGAELEPRDDNSCHLRSHLDTLEWLAFHLTTLGCEFEVLEPPELREYLTALGGRAIRSAR